MNRQQIMVDIPEEDRATVEAALIEAERFGVAATLASAASELDFLQSDVPMSIWERRKSKLLVHLLHRAAQRLAGSRAALLYYVGD